MTDELDALKAALKTAQRASDPTPEAKAAALRRAMENYDALQGSARGPRLSPNRPSQAGILERLRHMLKTLTAPATLAATSSAAALCIGLLVAWQPQLPQSIVERPIPAAPVQAAPMAPPMAADQMALDQTARAAPKRAMALPLAAASPEAAALPEATFLPAPQTETFANAAPNPVKITAEEPVSTFSVDVDTASYAYIRAALNAGQLPPPEAVRIEEMVNYFPYAYPAPAPTDAPFSTTITTMQTPWNPDTRLVSIGLQGRLPAARPALNLVFLIDTSGSMAEPDKLPLLQQSLALMLGNLGPDDRIAIVAYAGSAGEVLAPTPASNRAEILAAMQSLAANGSTGGAAGLTLAYQVAATMRAENSLTRVILATDGDFNLGISDPADLKSFIETQRDSGTYLSVLGFGRGNLDDATMQALAQNGNGTASYIDTLSEAQKVLGDQLAGAMFPIAQDVKVQVEWNPAQVAEYRLIGYETRALQRQYFNNDRIDAGEIGAGTQVTALYEITPPGSEALRNEPLRYGQPATTPTSADELGFLRLRYKIPGQSTSHLIQSPITDSPPSDETRFAAAIAGWGQLLQNAPYLGSFTLADAIQLATSARGADPYGYRAEAITLMRLSQSLKP